MQEVTTSWQRKGRQEGRQEGLQEALNILLAARFGSSSQALEARLQQCQDVQVLKRLVAAVGTCSSLQELEGLM